MPGVRNDILDPIIDELIARRLRGEAVNESTLSSEFRDHAADLRPILAKLDRIDRARVRALSENAAKEANNDRRDAMGIADGTDVTVEAVTDANGAQALDGDARGLNSDSRTRNDDAQALTGDSQSANPDDDYIDPAEGFFSATEATFPQIGDGYVVLREITRGGQAIVYLARREEDKKLVALKVLRDGTLADERQRRRFEQEAAVLGRLSHPNLLALVAKGTTAEGRYWIATPFVEGDMLDPTALSKTRPLQDRLVLFVTICRAVQAAHTADVIHRDLKPSNIRFDRAGRPIVLDFGLAWSADDSFRQSITQSGQFLGTFLWASPEQARGDPDVTPASDVYSLGVILHQLLADGKFPPQVYEMIRRAIEPDLPEDAESSVRYPAIQHASLQQVLAIALARDPADRFADAGTLADAVEAAASRLDGPVQSRWIWRVGMMGLIIAIALVAMQFWGINPSNGVLPPGEKDPSAVALPSIRVNRQNSIGMVFSRIPAGSFTMGSPLTEPPRFQDEKQHEAVITAPFMMSVFETTQSQFEGMMGYNPSKFKGTNLPVERVSWDEAVEFCKRLSAKESKHYRLPSETEWEYACRAGSTTMWHFGNDPQVGPRYANYADRSIPRGKDNETTDDGSPYTHTVGAYGPNTWGLYDMHGNVWEWTNSAYVANVTENAPGLTTPTTTTISPDARRVARGGSWYDTLPSHRSANRNPLRPDLKNDNLGFRVVCEEAD